MPISQHIFHNQQILRIEDKDNPKICIQFAAKKARLIIDHYEDIVKFWKAEQKNKVTEAAGAMSAGQSKGNV